MADFGFDAQSFMDLYTAGCLTCLGDGYIEIDGCTCGAGPALGIPGAGHEPMCGTVPCPGRVCRRAALARKPAIRPGR